MTKFIKQNFILILSIAVFILLPFLYYNHKCEAPDIYLQCIATGVILLFGYATYKFQKETNEFNRLGKIPALIVKKDPLEKEKEIHIENQSDYPAKNVYIGSFLFTNNGESHTILYDEIQLQIIKSYPIIQSDILKEDFRREFEDADKNEYNSPLRERIKNFISKKTKVYLVIALRSQFMNENETLFFFYECNWSNQNALLDTLSFTSKHFSIKEQLYEKSLKEISNRYEEYRKKYKKL